MRTTQATRRTLAVLLALALPLTAWACLPLPSRGADATTLQQEIQSSRDREQALSSAAARLARLETAAGRAVSLMEGRLTRAQAQVSAWEGRLASTRTELEQTRRRALKLRLKLERDRASLADTLRAAYIGGRPDLLAVVFDSRGFADLVDRMEFLKRVQRRNTRIVAAVRAGRLESRAQARTLATLAGRQARATSTVREERDALAQMAAALESRRATLAAARTARVQALSATRSSRRRAERTLARLEAAQRRAAVDKTGPGGPWAIPWSIVQCESGGQNLPPNWAGASGYYQFMPATWTALGGSTPNAYQAAKAEQDRLAARLWAGAAGARNWDCAAIVGIV